MKCWFRHPKGKSKGKDILVAVKRQHPSDKKASKSLSGKSSVEADLPRDMREDFLHFAREAMVRVLGWKNVMRNRYPG